MNSKYTSWFIALILMLASSFAPVLATGQATDKGKASIHGHAQDPLGKELPNLQVVLTDSDGQTKYTFVTDKDGNYQGSGINPGTYNVLLLKSATRVYDQFKRVKFAPGSDVQQDFDMTRPEYIAKLPEEERKQLEETRKKNAAIIKENANITQLNAQLKQAREDNKAKNYSGAESLMSSAVKLKPDAAVLWTELGIAQVGLKKNDDAVASLTKAISLDNATGKPTPAVQGSANNALGEAYVKTNKFPEAAAAYDAAAKAMPANASMYYDNEAILLNRAGQADATIAAADKSIAADPKNPLPYYLKGQALITKATVDPKTNRIVAAPGTEEAYEKYLDLAPDGPFANDVKQILAQIGAKIHDTYRAGKKH